MELASVADRPVTSAGRRVRLTALAGVAGLTTYVYAADPNQGGVYPLCPSQTLFGVDCPLCGGLRGTHALLHGRISEALDHNILLPIVLATAGVLLALWLSPLVGVAERRIRAPRWLVFGAISVLLAFGVVRNLPFAGLDYLASGAS